MSLHGKGLFLEDPVPFMEQGTASTLQGETQFPGKSMPKEDRVELGVFIEIIWKEKNPSEMAVP